MKRLTAITFFFIFVVSILGIAGWQSAALAMDQSAITSTLVLKVTDPDKAAGILGKKAEELGGWFFERTNESIKLKVPVQEAKSFLAFVEQQGIVAFRKYSSDQLAIELSERQSALKSREEVLTQYFAVLEKAKKAAVLTVEREIVDLTRKIETLKGEIRVLRHRADFAQITVDFRFRDRSAPVAEGRSSFPWLNTMNISDLVGDYQYAHE